MNISTARDYYKNGVIVGFYAQRSGGLWKLRLQQANGSSESWELTTALNEVKFFASLDTLIGEVERIGFRPGELTIL